MGRWNLVRAKFKMGEKLGIAAGWVIAAKIRRTDSGPIRVQRLYQGRQTSVCTVAYLVEA